MLFHFWLLVLAHHHHFHHAIWADPFCTIRGCVFPRH